MPIILSTSTPLSKRYADGSPRTAAIRTPYRILVTSLMAFTVSMGLIVGGSVQNSRLVARSSTPLNSELVFSQTRAPIVLKGIYTDEQKSFLVARFSISPDARRLLPSDLKSYLVSIKSDSYTPDTKHTDVLLSSLSTDGDMFIGIPNPGDGLFTVFLGETDPQVPLETLKLANSAYGDLGDKSLSEYLSHVDVFDGSKAEQNLRADDVKSGGKGQVDIDALKMRLTIAPVLDRPEYAVTVLKTRLLEDGVFNGRGFFNEVFKRSLVKEQTMRYQDAVLKLRTVEETVKEFERRIVVNPSDKVALGELNKARAMREQLNKVRVEAEGLVRDYNTLVFDDRTMVSRVVKAKVLH